MGDLTLEQLQHAVLTTEDDLDEWRHRVGAVQYAEAGSPLDLDAQSWPGFPVGVLSWNSLAMSTDHLLAVHRQLIDEATRVFATFTLTRSALLSACQAVWMIASDDSSVRQDRGMYVAAEEGHHRQTWLKETLPMHVGDALQARQAELEGVARRNEELRQARMLRSGGQKMRGQADSTSMIRDAAKHVFPGNVSAQTDVVGMWRSSSGDAHALGWGRNSRTPPSAYGARGEVELGLDLEQTVKHYRVAYMAAHWGWVRWDELAHRDTE